MTEVETPVPRSMKAPRAGKAPKGAASAVAANSVVRGGKSHPTKAKGVVPGKLQSKIAKPTEGAEGAPHRKKRRFRNGVRAVMEMRKLQKTTHRLLRKLPFIRFVREIAQDRPLTSTNEPARFQAESFEALQDAAETYLTDLFTASGKVVLHRKRITLEPRDIRLALYVAGTGIALSSERQGINGTA